MRPTLAIVLLLFAAPLACADEIPDSLNRALDPEVTATAWPELKTPGGNAFRSDAALYIVVDEGAKSPLHVPRMSNPIERVRWIGETERQLPFKPQLVHWEIGLAPAPTAGPRIVVVETVGKPEIEDPKRPWAATPDDDGRLQLPAHRAITHGKLLRYEPQPHKNTIGYWANADDWAEWHIDPPKPGTYVVRIQQGCGAGQGGSDVAISVGKSIAKFSVVDTGHFQNFRWRRVGEIEITKAGPQTLQLRCLDKAKNAVLDCRAIELVPKDHSEK